MPDKIKQNLIDRYIDNKFESGDRKYIDWIKLGISILLYILTICFLIQIQNTKNNNGIISQIQVLISVYMVVSVIKKGYIAALIINGLQILLAMAEVFQSNDFSVLPGVIIPICTVVIITIISFFERRLNKKMAEVIQQKEELTALYEDLTATEEELSRQNQQLLEYNRLLVEKEEKLNYLAYFDSLTGIPNRKMIINRLELLINFSKKNKLRFAVVFIDLDNFKRINDSMGHQTGDLLLQAVVVRLKTLISTEDLLGRLGGDEFALIIQRPLKEAEILEYVERLRKVLIKPLAVEGTELSITASLGISIYPLDGNDSAELLKCADTAMYKAKDNGKNVTHFFRKEMKDEILKKIEFENRLFSAIQNREIFLVFQPQYHSDTKELRGFETLVRWQSPELGLVSPVNFIHIAEETRFIIPLGEWILKAACTKFKDMQTKYSGNLMIDVNISAVQIMEPTFVPMVKNVLEETGVDGKYLEFEITESVFISSIEKAIRVFDELKELGIHIALDDFGTGYSSLNYIQQLSIDTLKIDRTFITNIGSQNPKKQIVGSIISLVHQLDIFVVAEGVENEIQLAYLKEHQCDYIQGYLWGKPLNEQELDRLLQELNKVFV